MRGEHLRARLGGPPCCCWVCVFSAPWCQPGSGLSRGSLGPSPDMLGPGQRAPPRRTSGRSRGSSPAAPPPSPNFLSTSRPAPLGAPLRFPHELFSSMSSNQRARGSLAEPPLWESCPAPREPLPPGPGAARPSSSAAQPLPGPARPAPRRSLPPSRSVPARAPTIPAREESTRPGGASRATPGRGGDRERPAQPPPPGAGPRGPGGTPTPATSCCAPARRGHCQHAPGPPPARAAQTRGHTWRRRPVPRTLAWARAEGPDGESRAEYRRPPAQGESDLGGRGPPKLSSDPTRVRRRHGAPGAALLGFVGRSFGR